MGGEGSTPVSSAPPLALAKAFSRSGCGRIFPLFSGVMREGLSTGPRAKRPGSGLSGPIFSGPVAFAGLVNFHQVVEIVLDNHVSAEHFDFRGTFSRRNRNRTSASSGSKSIKLDAVTPRTACSTQALRSSCPRHLRLPPTRRHLLSPPLSALRPQLTAPPSKNGLRTKSNACHPARLWNGQCWTTPGCATGKHMCPMVQVRRTLPSDRISKTGSISSNSVASLENAASLACDSMTPMRCMSVV